MEPPNPEIVQMAPDKQRAIERATPAPAPPDEGSICEHNLYPCFLIFCIFSNTFSHLIYFCFIFLSGRFWRFKTMFTSLNCKNILRPFLAFLDDVYFIQLQKYFEAVFWVVRGYLSAECRNIDELYLQLSFGGLPKFNR